MSTQKRINGAKFNKLIGLCGGKIKLSYLLTETMGHSVTQAAIDRWLSRRIPPKYWSVLSKISGKSVDYIAEISEGE